MKKQDTSPDHDSGKLLYRLVWRWHFYAGLMVIPFLLILSVTGAIYLFKPQWNDWYYQNLVFVESETSQSLSTGYEQQLNRVQQSHPGGRIIKFLPPSDSSRSSQFIVITKDDRVLGVYVNPFNGEILGTRDKEDNLQAIVSDIHGRLMIGTTGDRLVELAACWALILIISGLYLWWPRGKISLRGILIPRLGKGRRIFWRDLHAVPAFYASLVVIFLILSGLPWSGFWGNQFANVMNQFPDGMRKNVPVSVQLSETLNTPVNQTIPWPLEKAPLPVSNAVKTDNPITLDDIVTIAEQSNVVKGYGISMPRGAKGVFTVSVTPADPANETTLHIDQYSGEVLADIRWHDYGWVPKAVEMGVSIHTGRYFGWANQLLMLFACIVLVLTSVTGAVMWWQRKPDGKLGAPRLLPDPRVMKRLVIILAVFGLLFPLAGLSLLVVMALDFLLLSRVATLKYAFK